MSYSEALADCTVAISVSDSPDLGAVGMTDAHLRDATVELARHLIALGSRIAYGGDLRQGGFSEILYELVIRHQRDADEGDLRSAVLSYLAWPVHISMPVHDIERYSSDLKGLISLILLNENGEQVELEERLGIASRSPERDEWGPGLTAMRERMVAETNARIVAGGRTEGYLGKMPGVAEEAMIALRSSQPLFVLGGFGGCAADIAQAIGLTECRGIALRDWGQQDLFGEVTVSALANGLSLQENRTLAETPHVDEAIALVLRGLLRLASRKDAHD